MEGEFGRSGVQVSPISSTQAKIAEWVLELSMLSSSYDKLGSLSDESYERFLDLVMTLTMILEPYILKNFKWAEPWVEAIKLYRINQEEFKDKFPHRVIAWYRMGTSDSTTPQSYSSWEEFTTRADELRKRHYKVVGYRILPADDMLRALARIIVATARDIGILAFSIKHKPKPILEDYSEQIRQILMRIKVLAETISKSATPEMLEFIREKAAEISNLVDEVIALEEEG